MSPEPERRSIQTDSPDTAHSAEIEDHWFTPPPNEPWGRCQYVHGGPEDKTGKTGKCGLSLATHKHGSIEDTDPGRPESMRVPDPADLRDDLPYRPASGEAKYPPEEFLRRQKVERPTTPAITDAQIAARTAGAKDVVGGSTPSSEPSSEAGAVEGSNAAPKTDERAKIMETSGHKDDAGKPSTFYIPHRAKQEVGEVMKFGAEKYSPGNYLKGMDAARLIDASDRHVVEWVLGVQFDKESGKSPLAHSICCLMMVREMEIAGVLIDNRIELALTLGLRLS